MFGRNNSDTINQTSPEPTPQSPLAHSRETTPHRAVGASPTASRRAAPETARRNDRSGQNSDNGERRLTVGRGLSLSGEIAACDILVVEGKVEAKLTDGKLLEITESGQFRGSVEIENADIAGRYDGQLTVHGRLTVRGTGRVSGMVKYGEIEVVAGGQIIGEMQVVGAAAQNSQTAPGTGFKNAAKMAVVDDAMAEDDASTETARKAS